MTDALLRASVHGALFAGVVWIACRLFPRMPAWLRCSLWWLACLKVLVSLASPIDLPILPAEPLQVSTMSWSTPPAVEAPLAPQLAAAPTPQFSWPIALAGIWLAGLALQLAWTARQLRNARRIVRQSEPVDDPAIVREFAELRWRLGLERRIDLRISAEVEAPQVLGLIRPVVLLPTSRSLAPSDLSMALCHELVHVRRADLWWGWVPAVAQRLFWFHPLVRLAAREYALAREAACDAEVLRVLDPEPQAYGRLLLRLGVAPRAACTAAAGAAPSVQTLKRRLQMLEQTSSKRRQQPLLWASLIVVLALAAVVPFRIVAEEAKAPEAPPALPAPPAPVALPADAPEAVPPAEPAPVGDLPAAAPVALARATPPTPPVPPTPPTPPVPPKWGWSKDETYVLLLGKHRTMMSGSMSDIHKAKDLQKGNEPLLYFRRGGKEYVVRDAATLKAAEEIFRPQAELGAQQGELVAQQGQLGAQQGALGAQQGALGAQQAALAAKQVRLGEDDDEGSEALQAQMEELGRQQEGLGRQQEALGRQQEALGRQQEALGRQQERLSREAEKKFRALVDEAVQKGVAQEVK